MTQSFTFKSVLVTLLMMLCSTVKAETVSYTDNVFTYKIDLETQEATLSKYSGNAANVVIPENVLYKGEEYKVTSLGQWCFMGCSSLVSVEIPSLVTSLEPECFSGCSSLISVSIPSSVTSLGSYCFYGCSSLVSINIPSSVMIIGGSCFSGCSSLASIEIPSSVTSLGKGCFSNCSSLETIVVGANNPCYDSREGCNAIIETASNTMITGCKNTIIPSSVTSLGDYCFSSCSSLVSIAIPSSVTSLGNSCFSGCSSLTSVAIPSSVTSIGSDCFYGCSSLVSVVIPSSVTSLGAACFYGCSSLVSVVIPSSVTSLGAACFYGCSSLVSIAIPSSVTSLGAACFYGCSSLVSIDIPFSVTSLGDRCFWDCSSLASIDIPSSVASLGYQCFWGCSSLASIVIPSSVTSLGNSCFYGCSSLASIEIPSSVTSLGEQCFWGCSSLASIEIPSSVTSLEDYCFWGCSSLTSIVIPSSVTSIRNRCFYGCSSLASIDVPSSVTSLGSDCFWGCSSLTSVAIPSSVTFLGSNCFSSCSSLVSIDIPSSVTSLGYQCFSSCSSLQTVTCRMKGVKSANFFLWTPIENATLYVPESLLATYQNTTPWSSFGTILPLEKELITINEGENYEIASTERYGKVTFNRTLVEGWNGLVLPFDMTVKDVKTTFNAEKVKNFTGISYNEAKGVTLQFANFAAETTVISAGTPFMVKAKAGTSYVIDNAVLPTTGLKNRTAMTYYGNIKYIMKGTYAAKTDLTDVSFVLINGNNFFYHCAGRNESSAKAFRAYFENASEDPAAARVSFAFDDEEGTTTAISEVVHPTKADGTYYDLQGRRVDGMQKKGIYILNGRKVVK